MGCFTDNYSILDFCCRLSLSIACTKIATKQGARSTLSLPTSDLGNIGGWLVKGLTLGPSPFLVSDLNHGYPAIPYDKEQIKT